MTADGLLQIAALKQKVEFTCHSYFNNDHSNIRTACGSCLILLKWLYFFLVCAEGWRDVNGKCYLFSKDLNDTIDTNAPKELPFEEAVVQCHRVGGRLFEPRNERAFFTQKGG